MQRRADDMQHRAILRRSWSRPVHARRKACAIAGAALAAHALASASTAIAAPPDGSVVRGWTALAEAAVRAANASDAQAARMYAMVDAAMFDAVNGTAGHGAPRPPAIVAAPHPQAGDATVAAAGAAHDVLVALDPARSGAYDVQLAADLAGARSAPAADAGRGWGAQVAAAVLEARRADGSSPDETQLPIIAPGFFDRPWSGVQFRGLAPFAIADPSAYLDDGPPALDSRAYADGYDEVKLVGDVRRPDDAAKATFDFWSLGAHTDQPPGAWLQVADAVSRGLSLARTARLFALESMALADTVGPTYEEKARYRMWRPTPAIQQGDADGNRATLGDGGWSARAGAVGSSPQHWSGHSAFSAAGATVLAGFLCDDDTSFELVTDSAPGGAARSYRSFSQAAAEAGRSRVLGGLHFPFSDVAGRLAGRAIAREVLRRALGGTRC
ncbi:MAG: hypothetical protein QOI73_1133 [Solirubrobacteraceae bacterium]|nr:hypothetical protein [Solirubrobacteraceae bacterium]